MTTTFPTLQLFSNSENQYSTHDQEILSSWLNYAGVTNFDTRNASFGSNYNELTQALVPRPQPLQFDPLPQPVAPNQFQGLPFGPISYPVLPNIPQELPNDPTSPPVSQNYETQKAVRASQNIKTHKTSKQTKQTEEDALLEDLMVEKILKEYREDPPTESDLLDYERYPWYSDASLSQPSTTSPGTSGSLKRQYSEVEADESSRRVRSRDCVEVPADPNAFSTKCKWVDNPCEGQVYNADTHAALNYHLHHFHGHDNYPSKDKVQCLWAGCRQKLQPQSMARHIMTVHIRRKILAQAAGVDEVEKRKGSLPSGEAISATTALSSVDEDEGEYSNPDAALAPSQGEIVSVTTVLSLTDKERGGCSESVAKLANARNVELWMLAGEVDGLDPISTNNASTGDFTFGTVIQHSSGSAEDPEYKAWLEEWVA